MMTQSSSPHAGRARLVCLLGCILLAASASGIDILVRNNNNNGPGSLRQAVTDNNGLGGGNTIVFSNIVTGTITLTSGDLLITTNVTIRGPGPDVLTVSGNNASRIFNVSGGSVAISGLTIASGRAQVADQNSIPGNSGGGILNQGTLNLTNCTLTVNVAYRGGGAVLSTGNLTADRCAFFHNGAAYGGGLALGGTSSLNHCTITGNYTEPISGAAGGIYNSGILTVSSCTIVGNDAGAPPGFPGGGGIFGSAIVRNTIIAGNYAHIGPDVSGTFVSEGYNLIGAVNGSTGFGGVGDQLGTTNSRINPNLLPLGYYTGLTATMPPASGSPAIDQGRNFSGSTDQRGRPRTYDNPAIINATLGDGTDIGAVEISLSLTLAVTNSNDSGPGSLRQAVLEASLIEDKVVFAPNVTNTITLTSGQVVVNKSLTIAGPGADLLTISGNNSSRVLHLTGGSVSLSGLTIANGAAPEGGGILVDGGSHTISQCHIVSNAAIATLAGGGGVLLTSNATLQLHNCSIIHNRADFSGGGIAHNGSNLLTIVSCTIASNRLTYLPDGLFYPRGGGVALVYGSSVVVNSTIASNYSTATSGGFDNSTFYPGTVDIRNSIVAGNSAPSGAPDVLGPFISGGYNLIGNSSGGTGFGATGDQLNVNPMLGPLANYGGPTLTMALRSGSPAIDKGKSFGHPTDQRGFARPVDDPNNANASGGDGADIGALEVDSNLRTVNVRLAGGDFALGLMTVLGRNHRVEYATALSSNAANWTAFTDNVPGNGHTLWVTNFGGANQSLRFYRAVIVP